MSEITANFNKLVDFKDMSFRFRKDEFGNQRPKVELKVAVPSVEGIAEILQKGGKGLEYLQDVVADAVRAAVLDYVADTPTVSQDNFPQEKYTWDAIANRPRSERASIAPEVWEAFAKDYQAVMPGVTGKSIEAVTNATIVYLKKFTLVKNDKPALEKLKQQLALYMENSQRAEEFTPVLEFLLNRLETYLTANDVTAIVGNL